MSKRARTRAARRDRRKARASGWRREGKQRMGRVGHGASGPTTRQVSSVEYVAPIGPVPHSERPDVKPEFRLRVSVAEIAKRRG